MAFQYSRSLVNLSAVILSLSTFTFAQTPVRSNAADRAMWELLMPKIRAELERNNHQCDNDWKIGIIDLADVTGDGVLEAVVDYCNGGAYTDWLVLMRLEKGKPVIARERMQDGRYANAEGASGSSVMHSASFELHPEQHAIYNIVMDLEHEDERGRMVPEEHTVDVSVWNPKTRTFDWNAKLSKQLSSKKHH
jgi:hypothetical protein